MVRNNQRTLTKELVRDSDAFAEESARILTQIENQPFQISHLVERLGNFMFRSLIELRDVHITDAGSDQKMQVHAVTRYFITHHSEFQGLLCAFALNADADGGSLRSLQEIGHVAGTHVIGGF